MKKALQITLVLVSIVVVVLIFLYYNTSITVITEPANAKISINGQELLSGEKLSIKPGDYILRIRMDEYVDYDSIVNIGLGEKEIVNVSLRKEPIPEKIISSPGKFLTTSADKRSLYFLSGKTMYIAENIFLDAPKIEAISPEFFENVTDIIWSPDRSLAIIKQNQQSSLYNFKRYDLLHQEIMPYRDDGIKNVVWSSDSKHIMYYYEPNPNERTLIKATPANKDKEVAYNFLNTDIRSPKISWSNDQRNVLLVSNNALYLIDLLLNDLKLISHDKIVSESRFTSQGDIIMIAKDGTYIVDRNGQLLAELDFHTNLQRITFVDDDNVLIAQREDNRYKFYIYNLITSEKKELVYNHKYTINPIDQVITADGKRLYFESNNYIYKMIADMGDY
jgi:hypothetical protein